MEKLLKTKKTIVLFSALIVVFNFNLYSQKNEKQDSLKSYTLDEVIVSASKTEQNPYDVGRSISVIDANQINNSMFENVGDLLKATEGIQVIGSRQNAASNQSLFIRGTNSYHSVVMIDGIRISDPSSVNNAIELSELSLVNVERIEIIRGSHSTIYGSSAIGGIINIITKKNSSNFLNAGVSLKTGTFGKGNYSTTDNVFLNLNFKNGLYFDISAFQKNVKGIDATLDTITNPATFNNPDKDNFEKIDYLAKAGYRNNNIDFFVSYKKTSQRADLDKTAFKDDDNRYIDFNRSLLNYGVNYKLSDNFSMSFSGGYSQMQRKDIDDSSVVSNLGTYDHQYAKSIFDGSYLTNEMLAKYNSGKISAILGVNLNEEKMNNFNYVYSYSSYFGVYESTTDLDSLDLNSKTKSLFFHTDINGKIISEKLKALNLSIGARVLNHSSFGNNFVYEINPSYKINPATIFYASYSTAFNAPSLYRLYSPYKGFGFYSSRGNENLSPETSLSFEFGFKQKINKNTNFSLAFFNTKIKNLIEYVYLWDKNIGIDTLGNDWLRNDYKGDTYINLSEQKINGVELAFNTEIEKKIFISGNFTYLTGLTIASTDGIDTSQTGGHHVQLFESGIFVDNKENENLGLIRRPSSMIDLSITYLISKKLRFNFASHFVGQKFDVAYNSTLGPYGALDKEFVKSYNVSDISLKYDILENLFVAIQVKNIFDTDYIEINGYST
ncbi:MAG: TonB-dependent receptor, partial [Bacteroidota bacterium]|nr:TonB-dependent receptor [Bacteroidota bacterium]